MKRCPRCGRDYNDDSMSFCLDDGSDLLFGPGSVSEPQTAFLHKTAPAGEAETQPQIFRTDETAVYPTAFARTPEQGRYKRLIAVPILLAIIAVGGYFAYKSSKPSAGDTINSIAVLPFENRSGNADTDYLSDGLAESLIYRLSQLRELKVSPTSSVFRYKGRDTDPQVVAKELGVDSVMTGRITQRGDNLTISVNLVDARNGKSLWGEKYDRKLSDLLATQREIAATITQKLQLELSGNESTGITKKYTDNNEAYQLYLKGRFHYARRTDIDLKKAIDNYQQALKLDPNFALAYVGIAQTYNVMPANYVLAPKEAFPKAKAAAEHALAIDHSLSEAHGALATTLALYEWNWAEAEREYLRAIEIDPNVAENHYFYGLWHLAANGRSDESIREVSQALAIEPLSVPIGANLAAVLIFGRKYDLALEQAKKAYNLDANSSQAASWLVLALTENGLYSEAVSLNEKMLSSDPTNPRFLSISAYVFAKNGQRQKAEELLARIVDGPPTRYLSRFRIAGAWAALGERDRAFEELEQAFADRDVLFTRLKVDPLMDPLRDDPRYADLLRRMNLSK